MMHWANRSVLSLCAAALLAGCGGSQPPIGAPEAMEHIAIANPLEKSMSGELLYAASTSSNDVLVFSYPKGALVQTLTGFEYLPSFICSDRSGNVFVPTTSSSASGVVYEFAHGGTKPTQTLIDPGPESALSCSVDPMTGNLAVANGWNVAIYPYGQSTPTIYKTSDVGALDCAYDGSGDLFVDSTLYQNKIAELPAGSSTFSDIALSQSMITGHMQWWNGHLLIEEPPISPKGPYKIFQVNVSDSMGTVSGPVLLRGKNKHRGRELMEFAIAGETLVMPDGPDYTLINSWHYPKGGKPYKVIDLHPHDQAFYGIAISK